MNALLVNQSPVSSITYSNKMRVIYDGVEQDAELRKYPSGKIYFRTENAHFVPVNEVGVLIPLTKGKSAIVDFEDYERITAMGKWCCGSDGYAIKNIRTPVGVEGKRFTNIQMHRVIMNAPKHLQVDHIWGDTLDNRKEKLRLCTVSQNACNRGKNNNNSSGYKGVWYRKSRQKWQADLVCEGKLIYLGLHTCPIEAAKAYNEGAVKYFGEFAKLNEIPNGQ